MENNSMTAQVSAFARAYHAEHSVHPVFADTMARRLLSEATYNQIALSMQTGIGFFNPDFHGTAEEGLRWIVEHQLAPSPLGRAAFAEENLHQAVLAGAQQYVLLGAGYDTFAYRQPAWAQTMTIFEVEQPEMTLDKQQRLSAAGITIPSNVHAVTADFNQTNWEDCLINHPAFDVSRKTFVSLLGVVYYLPEASFVRLLHVLFELLAHGSRVAFDYPTPGEDDQSRKQAALAHGAKETMQAVYTPSAMASHLTRAGFQPITDLNPDAITRQYFAAHNAAEPNHTMYAFPQVHYCLTEKK